MYDSYDDGAVIDDDNDEDKWCLKIILTASIL